MGQVTSKLFGEVESGNGRASAIAPNMGIFIRKSQTTFLHIRFQHSPRRRSADALLTLASPSAQVTQSRS
jgi:hypothetical protein